MRLCKECGIRERKIGKTARYCVECAIEVKKIKHRIADRNYVKKHKERVLKSRRKRDRLITAKLRYARYRNTEKYKKYSNKRYHQMDDNKRKARYFVSNAVRDRKLTRPRNCEKCGIKDWGKKRSMIEAHHFKGYEPPNWLKIQWLCTNCHKLSEGGGLRAI